MKAVPFLVLAMKDVTQMMCRSSRRLVMEQKDGELGGLFFAFHCAWLPFFSSPPALHAQAQTHALEPGRLEPEFLPGACRDVAVAGAGRQEADARVPEHGGRAYVWRCDATQAKGDRI